MAAIICLGIAVRDLVFEVPVLPLRAQKISAPPRLRLMAAAWRPRPPSPLPLSVGGWSTGDDSARTTAGRELQQELEARGVRVRAHIALNTRTPTSAVIVDSEGERMLAVFTGELPDDTAWLPLADVAAAQAVLADIRWPNGARAMFTAAAAKKVTRRARRRRGRRHGGALAVAAARGSCGVFSRGPD